MHRILFFFSLMLVWIIFSGMFDAFHLSLGVISALLVTWISADMVFDKDSPSKYDIIIIMLRLPGYFLWMFKEIMLANLHVLYLALAPAGIRHIEPAIIHFHTCLKHPAARYLLANSITLTPGTVTISLRENELYVHSISRKTTVSLEGDMEHRIAYVFGEKMEVKT